jgi:hypothetical protein
MRIALQNHKDPTEFSLFIVCLRKIEGTSKLFVEKFTARLFCGNIVPQIAEQRSLDAQQNRGRKFVVHIDNATLHRTKLTKSCFKTHRLREADHPPYSTDLAPSDFYFFSLFGKLKGQMAGSKFESPEDLFAMIRRLTNAISREELEFVFQEWERRLEECMPIGRDDVLREEFRKLLIIITAAFDVPLLSFNRTPDINQKSHTEN